MNKPPRPVKVRQATKRDIPALIELNRAAYPGLAVENVVWGEAHLLSHQRMFPEGQWLAEVGGKIVGAVATLIVDLGRDPLRPHTWAGITDSGPASHGRRVPRPGLELPVARGVSVARRDPELPP